MNKIKILIVSLFLGFSYSMNSEVLEIYTWEANE